MAKVGSSPHPEEVEAAGAEPAQGHLLHVEQAQDRLHEAEEGDIDVDFNFLNLHEGEEEEGDAEPEVCRHQVELCLRGHDWETEEQGGQVCYESNPVLDVMQDSETIVGGADRGAGFDLWSSLGGLKLANELGVDGEDGQKEGGE